MTKSQQTLGNTIASSLILLGFKPMAKFTSRYKYNIRKDVEIRVYIYDKDERIHVYTKNQNTLDLKLEYNAINEILDIIKTYE